MKPQSIEAAAGKNPIDHTGKLYSIAANKISKHVSSMLNSYVEVYINSNKHQTLENADLIIIRTPYNLDEFQKRNIKNYVNSELSNSFKYTKSLIQGELILW